MKIPTGQTPPLFLHLHEFAAETQSAMLALELRTVMVTGSPAFMWEHNSQTLTISEGNVHAAA